MTTQVRCAGSGCGKLLTVKATAPGRRWLCGACAQARTANRPAPEPPGTWAGVWPALCTVTFLLLLAFGLAVALVASRASKLSRNLTDAEEKVQRLETDLRHAQAQWAAEGQAAAGAAARLDARVRELTGEAELLRDRADKADDLQREVQQLRGQIDRLGKRAAQADALEGGAWLLER